MIETNDRRRKEQPVCTGALDYFPDALMAVAELSRIGNEQHNPGKPMHWDRSKSTAEADSLLRHLIDRGKLDTDGIRHSAKVAWRALALLQKEIEAERADDVVNVLGPIIQEGGPACTRCGSQPDLTAYVPVTRQPDDFAAEPEPRPAFGMTSDGTQFLF